MRKIFTIILFALVTSNLFAQQPLSINWDAPIMVANGSTYGYTWPRITLTNDNVPVVMIGKNIGKDLFVTRYNGTSFDTPVKINPGNKDAFLSYWAGPDLASRGDTVFATFKLIPTVGGFIYTVRSLDGGLNFDDTVRVENIGNHISRFPGMDVAPGGNPVVTFMKFDSAFGEPEYVVCRSLDGGLTYAQDIPGSYDAPGEVCDCCPTDIYVDGEIQLLPFRNNDNNIRDNWVAVSRNAGVSYDTVVRADTSNWFIQVCPSQGPDVTRIGDTILTAFVTAANGQNEVWLSAMNLTNYNLDFMQIVDTTPAGNQRKPRLASSGDTVAVIYEDRRNGDFDCFINFSVNGPSNLFNAVGMRVTPSTGNEQDPDIAYANGTFHVVYTDNSTQDVYYRTGTIGLATAIKTEVLENTLRVYPNPARDYLQISYDKSFSSELAISMMDMQGKEVLKKSGKGGKFTLDTKALNTGIYMLYIQSQEGIHTRKIMID